MSEPEFPKLCAFFRKMLKVDAVRITIPMGTMFLIIGTKRNTKQDPGQWIRDGEPFDFDYIDERVIASGKTVNELIASVLLWKKLSKMTWSEYLPLLIEEPIHG